MSLLTKLLALTAPAVRAQLGLDPVDPGYPCKLEDDGHYHLGLFSNFSLVLFDGDSKDQCLKRARNILARTIFSSFTKCRTAGRHAGDHHGSPFPNRVFSVDTS